MQPFAINVSGDGTPTDHEIALGLKLAATIDNRKALSGLQSAYGTLPSANGYLTGYNIGGVTRITVIRNSSPEQIDNDLLEEERFAHLAVPVMYSGQVLRGVCTPGAGLDLDISYQTQRRLAGYNDDKIDHESRIAETKFEVSYNNIHDELWPEETYGNMWTQYRELYPTWFSGLMGSVVQIVAGYGKQIKGKRNNLFIPDSVYEAIELEVGKYKPHGCKGKPPLSGQIQFDYKYYTGNGVVFGDDGKPWLLSISETYGAMAMPLPMIPSTCTKAFRDYIEKVNDTEILEILDRFGGMPSGEGFPDNWTDWERAGVVVKMCDMGAFYYWLPLAGTTLGWSFSETTREAVNSGYNYGPTTMQKVAVYSLRFTIPAISTAVSEVDAPERLSEYLSETLGFFTGNSGDAAQYKMGRMPSELKARVEAYFEELDPNSRNPEAEFTYWDGATAPPLANCTAALRKTNEGNVWGRFGEFKLPMTQGEDRSCYSHEFRPWPDPDKEFSDAEITFDTVVYAYFVGDDLKHIHCTNDPRKKTKEEPKWTVDDMFIIGEEEYSWGEGEEQVFGNFYTSDFDERESRAPAVVKLKRKGWHDAMYPWSCRIPATLTDGNVYRTHQFRFTETTDREDAFTKRTGVCVPFYNRDGCVHGYYTWSMKNGTNHIKWGGLAGDPYSYRCFMHGPFSWVWTSPIDVPSWTVNGLPVYDDDYTVQVHTEYYNPYILATWRGKFYSIPWPSELEQEPWLKFGQNVTDLYWGNLYTRHPSYDSDLLSSLSLSEYTDPVPDPEYTHGKMELSYLPAVIKMPGHGGEQFYKFCPYKLAGVTITYMFTAHRNLMGKRQFATASDPGNTASVGQTRFSTGDGRHYFIGVINE